MAEVVVSKEVLETLADTLEEQAKVLRRAAGEIEALFPEEMGFTIIGGPPLNDALPALTDFSAEVDARTKEARHAKLFGPSAKLRRQERYKERRKNGTKGKGGK